MTFSIVARSADGQQLGVAVASKFLAVGAFVPAARAGVGAVASQSFVNLRYVPDGFALMEQGVGAQEVVARLTARRRAGGVAAARAWSTPRAASGTFTGSTLHRLGRRHAPATGYAVAGQLPGRARGGRGDGAGVPGERPDGGARRPAAHRAAGRATTPAATGAAGRAPRCTSSAPGGGYEGGSDVLVDLRVDDHADAGRRAGPAARPARAVLRPGRPGDPAAARGRGRATRCATGWRRLGRTGEDLDAVLFDWMGWENYEERHVAGKVDPVVLAALREATR